MQVEIWSDIVCPWCAVGKRRFEAALAAFPHADQVAVRWRSFELDPSAPALPDDDLVDQLAAKYGTSRGEAQGMLDRMTATAAADGWAFRLDRARPGNTFDAHRLLHLAADRGRQHAVKEAFVSAYLEDGVAIGDHGALATVAVDAGLDPAEVAEVLASGRYADAVRTDEQQARAYGITGVPFFVLDGRFGVSGAQPPEALLAALQQAWEASSPLTMVDAIAANTPQADADDAPHAHAHADGTPHADGDACADGRCAI